MDDVVLELPAGETRVRRQGGLLVAQGLRYASAQRFQVCQPVPPHASVVDATTRGPACPQHPSRLDFVTGTLTTGLRFDEDCLTVSVRAPVPDGCRRPVMVFFHGGAYVSGTGEARAYDLSALAEEGDVVTVAVTYRLGIFGFLAIPGVSPANLGLLDQMSALKWVQDNIAAFGGDPTSVTVFGQSAGADAISYLMVAEGTEGLFHRAILQSAPLGVQRGRAAMNDAMGRAARAALGRSPETASVEDTLAAQTKAAIASRRFGVRAQLPFGPQPDHYPLPPESEVESGRRRVAPRLPIMIGTTKDDAFPFVALSPRLGPLLRRRAIGAVLRRTLVAAATARLFSRPALTFARQHRNAGGESTVYRFDWRPADAPFGASHCIELPFLMGASDAWVSAPMLGHDAQPAVAQYGPQMRRTWARFAHGEVKPTSSVLHLPDLSKRGVDLGGGEE